ncbi:MAG: DUF427 domain-containing protein [Phycisphaerales bacterium]|nr:DUF427 domain-containing protein [Phycisphaerales bacterium]
MAKAIWNDAVLAESDQCEIVDGNHYFPPSSLNKMHFKDSPTRTTCPWKGEASYYHLDVNGEVNEDAAWCYPSTKEAAKNIEGHVAFWKGVRIEP